MLGQKYSYKWYSLEQLDTGVYDSINDAKRLKKSEILRLSDVKDDIKVRQDEAKKSNWHWSVAWPSIMEPRLMTFTGTIYAPKDMSGVPQIRKLEKKIEEFRKIIAVEGNTMADPYYDLNWWTRYNEQRTVKAKVYGVPEIKHEKMNPWADFVFELYSPDPRYYHPIKRTATGWKWTIGGTNLDNYLPNPTITSYTNPIVVDNKWNSFAKCKITVTGTGQNVVIYNTTNDYKIRVSWTTYNLSVSSLNPTNDPNKIFEVLEGSNDIRNRVVYWWWIYLNSWINNIVVLSDDLSDLSVVVERYDTYI